MTEKLDFETEKIAQFQELAGKKIMVLATSANDRVTARSMSVIFLDGKVYFQTDRVMEKARQIEANPNVALCTDDFQMTGTARILGPWGENKQILDEYLKVHKNSYLRYENLATEVLVEVVISKIKRWKYIEGNPYLYEMDLPTHTVELKPYLV